MTVEVQVEKITCVELRRATPEDRDALIEMYRSFEPKGAALGLPPWKDTEKWLDGLARYLNFVVFADGRLAGHGALCRAGATAEVAVFVHQDFRRRGLGQRLLAAMIREARRLGLRRVWGTAEMDNYSALAMVRLLGFVRGKHPNEYYFDLKKSNPVETELVSCT